MKKVGITGNIGSGKTTVTRIFSLLGIPIYDSDTRAKELMVGNKELVDKISNLLSKEAYFLDGGLNRKFISQKVFNNPNLLQQLNALVHPAVFEDFESWVQKQDSAYILKEAALLFESNSYKNLDEIIVVEADLNTRIKRTMDRDGLDEDSVKARINNQMNQEEKIALANFVVHNTNSLLIPQVLNIHQKLLQSLNLIT